MFVASLIVLLTLLAPPSGPHDDAAARIRAAAQHQLAEHFPAEAHRLQVRVKRTGGRIPSDGPLRLAFPEEHALPRAHTQVKVLRPEGSGWAKTGWALLYVAHFDSVAVAREDLGDDEPVSAADLQAAWTETTQFRGEPLHPADVRALLARGEVFMAHAVREGRLLRRSDVRAAYAADTGETVALRYRRGTIRFELSCTAREPGHVGDDIRLYSSETDRMYRARLTGPGTADWLETL